MIEAWADRTAALSALPGIEQVFPFENRGEAIGVTLPTRTGRSTRTRTSRRARRRLLDVDRARGRPTCSRASSSSSSASERVILAGEHWTAFVPFAARWPLEVHLLPHRHVPDFAETTDAERDELAPLYLRLLRGVDALYDTPTPVHRGVAPGAGARAAATTSGCICSSPRRAAPPTSSSSSPAPRRRWAPGSATSPPEAAAARAARGDRSVHDATL